jgi:hypothetical protein
VQSLCFRSRDRRSSPKFFRSSALSPQRTRHRCLVCSQARRPIAFARVRLPARNNSGDNSPDFGIEGAAHHGPCSPRCSGNNSDNPLRNNDTGRRPGLLIASFVANGDGVAHRYSRGAARTNAGTGCFGELGDGRYLRPMTIELGDKTCFSGFIGDAR